MTQKLATSPGDPSQDGSTNAHTSETRSFRDAALIRQGPEKYLAKDLLAGIWRTADRGAAPDCVQRLWHARHLNPQGGALEPESRAARTGDSSSGDVNIFCQVGCTTSFEDSRDVSSAERRRRGARLEDMGQEEVGPASTFLRNLDDPSSSSARA
ncbi:hypothetical protein K438DRAFT_1776533 [Mycena galopus ATCC 62051]|nr:hypothetical protein K438DRAFT_1776533 [Mycena galopus ATCC 62051]